MLCACVDYKQNEIVVKIREMFEKMPMISLSRESTINILMYIFSEFYAHMYVYSTYISMQEYASGSSMLMATYFSLVP